jgi:two-component system, chemotaxis family, sensor kinase CheA
MIQLDDETLLIFIEEAKEHLMTIESDLLEIEQGGETIDEALVNKVFRAAHSIKGGASFLGLDQIKELSHKIENVLDMVRNCELVPTSALVNVLLKAFDCLGDLFEHVENSNEMTIDEHVSALKTAMTGSLSEGEQEIIHSQEEILIHEEGPKFKVSQFDLNQSRKGGKNLYLLEIDLIHDIQAQGNTPLKLINDLGDSGIIIDIQIGMEMVGDLDSSDISTVLPMYLLFATVIESDLLSTILGVESSKITLIPKGLENDLGKIEVSEEKSNEELPTNENTEPEPDAVIKEEKKAPQKQPVTKQNQNKKASVKPENLRVSVKILDQLMNRAGELVLARNELIQSIAGGDTKAMSMAGQRIDIVTSELQDAIMKTRMQPLGTVFNKFTRIVRDISSNLGKKITLDVKGSDVELDKSIIEGLGDPLTHLVRNSCDHGVENPDTRTRKGKSEEGTIFLRAFHESGQVIIEIEDDGKGLDADMLVEKAISKNLITSEQADKMSNNEKTALIMLPGFSTAEQVTDISGRGVGMDVVKTNLDQLGGHVELISKVDKGTTIRIKLPLTLAIIPSLLIENCDERFALPQVNVRELLRIPAVEIQERIEKVGEADVLILRGELIPLLQLNNVLNLAQTYYDQKIGIFREDRRASLADQRLLSEETQLKIDIENQKVEDISAAERRNKRSSDVVIVILQAGSFRFGLVVEKVHDTVEIVVKPLGRHLSSCNVYAGATIMGDGQVALILDVAGLGKLSHLDTIGERESELVEDKQEEVLEGTVRQTLLLFYNGPNEYCAVPLHLVLRLEQIESEDIIIKGGKKVIQYRGGSLPIYALEEVANVEMLEERKQLIVIIFVVAGREVGLLAIPPLDVIEQDLVIDEITLKQPGISGSSIINDETTLLVDIFSFMKTLNPDWFENRDVELENADISIGKVTIDKPILLAEDSMFFRTQVKQFMESEGYTVLDFEDGQVAWEYLDANPAEIGLVVTDLEMPRMDGFELAKRIKEDKRLSHLTVIALTSLASEEHMAKGKQVGIDDYQIKLDKEKLLQGVYNHLHSVEEV